MDDLRIDVKPINGVPDGVLIGADGFIDTTNAPMLEQSIENVMKESKFKIAINLENVEFISSAGWGVFVSEIREIREHNGDLVLVNMMPDVYDVYELMEFSSILRSFDSVEESEDYFKNM